MPDTTYPGPESIQRHSLGNGTIAAFALGEIFQNFSKYFAGKIRPQGIYKFVFRIGRLPEEEARQACLTTGPDNQVRIRKIGGVQVPSQSIGVDVIGGRTEKAVLIPVEALRQLSPGEYAVFVMENNQPKLQVVSVGLVDFTSAEIITGLEPGDVVTTGIVEAE